MNFPKLCFFFSTSSCVFFGCVITNPMLRRPSSLLLCGNISKMTCCLKAAGYVWGVLKVHPISPMEILRDFFRDDQWKSNKKQGNQWKPTKKHRFFSSKEASLKIFRMTQPGLDTRKKKGCLGKSQPWGTKANNPGTNGQKRREKWQLQLGGFQYFLFNQSYLEKGSNLTSICFKWVDSSSPFETRNLWNNPFNL